MISMNPAEIYGKLKRAIEEEKLSVEAELDINWIYLRKPGFSPSQFGDGKLREKHLGKWIAKFPRENVVEEAKRLLKPVHQGRIRLAKFTNIGNSQKETAIVAVYCMDADQTVKAVLDDLGWSTYWKYNHQTFSRN